LLSFLSKSHFDHLSNWSDIIHHGYNHDPLTCDQCSKVKSCPSCKTQLTSIIALVKDNLSRVEKNLENWLKLQESKTLAS